MLGGVSHWPFPFGGPGCACNVLTQRRPPQDRQRLPLRADTGETRTLQAGGPHTFPLLVPLSRESQERKDMCVGLGRPCNVRIAASINVSKCVLFSIDPFVPGIQGLPQAARIHIKHFKKMCISVCACTISVTGVCRGQTKGTARSPETGVTGCWEPPCEL